MIVVTGANGNLGKLVVRGLLEQVPADQIVATVRSLDKASELRGLGVELREADYTRTHTRSRGSPAILVVAGKTLRPKAHLIWPVVAGMLAHAAHWCASVTFHADSALAAGIAGLIVGTVLTPVAQRLRIPSRQSALLLWSH